MFDAPTAEAGNFHKTIEQLQKMTLCRVVQSRCRTRRELEKS